MKDIYMTSYSVRGIKTLDKLVNLSFYKKTITKDLADTQNYNVKGIYGMNGSGKSAIVTSVGILKNILINPEYLSNPIVQKNLDSMINKSTKELFMEVEFILNLPSDILLFRYSVTLSKDEIGKYVISHEKLSMKKATSKSENLITIFEVSHGELIYVHGNATNELKESIIAKTFNLLSSTSMCALVYKKLLLPMAENDSWSNETIVFYLLSLYIFARRIHVYLDQSDDHSEYIIENSLKYVAGSEKKSTLGEIFDHMSGMEIDHLSILEVTGNVVPVNSYDEFASTVKKLYEFIHIFKSELVDIEIDKKENKDVFICDLIMVYNDYKIYAEFESTGIKKLIKLFAYLNEMVEGSIVFIDEFDANIHDVYLCALLEYMMEYGEGQLCFTTHNVGPMDVLKKRKKSIEFLSSNHKVYSWTKNGNYSPSNLYREGMIEGSPFNIDSFDFIGAFLQL